MLRVVVAGATGWRIGTGAGIARAADMQLVGAVSPHTQDVRSGRTERADTDTRRSGIVPRGACERDAMSSSVYKT